MVMSDEQTGLRNWFRNGLAQRQMAALWMNILILGTLFIAFVTVWGGFGAHPTPHAVAIGALKAFTVWVLAFIPGWLYIRFLGQRAGALMSEYVLNLHRLGCDKPYYLPEPLKASPYWKDWHDGGGPEFCDGQNIYVQKFNAYYGRGTANAAKAANTETNFKARIDTLFPVFVTTVTLAVGWSAVLWNPSFINGAESATDVLKFTFLGAYAFIAQDLIRRFFQSDLRPSAYASALLRITFALVTMTALLQLIGNLDYGAQAVIAFVVGVVPLVALQALQRAASGLLRRAVPQVAPDYPLNDLTGLNIWYEARLVEEGIEDMENLTTANLVDVILHTRVPVGRLIDWLDQAFLALHLPPRELERDPKEFPQLPITRRALERRCIRTATDLIKAWPDEEPNDADGAGEPVGIAGLPYAETELLVRLLKQDRRIAPIWNWQHGCVERCEQPPAPTVLQPSSNGHRTRTVRTKKPA